MPYLILLLCSHYQIKAVGRGTRCQFPRMCFVLTDALCVVAGIWASAKAPMLVELEVPALTWEAEAALNSPLLGRAAGGSQNQGRMQV